MKEVRNSTVHSFFSWAVTVCQRMKTVNHNCMSINGTDTSFQKGARICGPIGKAKVNGRAFLCAMSIDRSMPFTAFVTFTHTFIH